MVVHAGQVQSIPDVVLLHAAGIEALVLTHVRVQPRCARFLGANAQDERLHFESLPESSAIETPVSVST
jgi:hypothetical protein